MSNIAWIGLLALAALVFLLLGYLMYRVRAKYIHIDVRSGKSPVSMRDQEYEYYRYEVEEYGCVSLLATVLGAIFCTVAIASFAGLLYQIVVYIIIPSLYSMIYTLAVINGIILALALGLLAIVSVLSFFKDLFNPPRKNWSTTLG